MTKATIATGTNFAIHLKSEQLAIISDLRAPYTDCGIHGEWRRQFINAINNPKYHKVLIEKLAPYGPYIICYTKITPEKQAVESIAGYPSSTVCVISSVGEHNMTPWMIIHNIGHTIISWNLWVKREIKTLLGLIGDNYQIVPIQQELVTCAASRQKIIPNINELIYELFTTWVWYGQTKSRHRGLAAYCDKTFPVLMERYKSQMFWHRFRCPTGQSTKPTPGIKKLLAELETVTPPIIPGIPGYSRTLKARRVN